MHLALKVMEKCWGKYRLKQGAHQTSVNHNRITSFQQVRETRLGCELPVRHMGTSQTRQKMQHGDWDRWRNPSTRSWPDHGQSTTESSRQNKIHVAERAENCPGQNQMWSAAMCFTVCPRRSSAITTSNLNGVQWSDQTPNSSRIESTGNKRERTITWCLYVQFTGRDKIILHRTSGPQQLDPSPHRLLSQAPR